MAVEPDVVAGVADVDGDGAAVVARQGQARHVVATARAGHRGIVPDQAARLRYHPPMTFPAATLTGIEPPGVLAGARLWLRGAGVPAPSADATVSIGGAPARVLFSAADRIAVEVPRAAPNRAGRRCARPGRRGPRCLSTSACRWPPACIRSTAPPSTRQGRVYAACSGPRGQDDAGLGLPRRRPTAAASRSSTGIVNATSLAFSPSGVLHVSSRYDGVVYRVLDDGRREAFVSELGVACGLAFAPDGSLFVGDRTGTVHRVSADGARTEVFATLPPSIAAYHLAMGPDGCLYVTGPTLATHDAIYRFDASGRREVIDRSFGRPQGLAFDAHGVLHVVEALAGVSAIYRCAPASARRAVVSGPGLVGVAFLPTGDLVAATADTLYRFPAIP